MQSKADYYAGDLASVIWIEQSAELALQRRLTQSAKPDSSATRFGKDRSVTERKMQLLKQSRLDDLEELQDRLAGHPVMAWLQAVDGIGPQLSALLIGLLEDAGGLLQFRHRSSLYRWCGLGVDAEGRAERPRKGMGEPLRFDRRLKAVLMGRIATQWIMAGRGLYHDLYRERRPFYAQRFEVDASKPSRHVDSAARRVAVKLFLSHLWEQARIMEGLPVEPPYPHAILGHTSAPIPAAEAIA